MRITSFAYRHDPIPSDYTLLLDARSVSNPYRRFPKADGRHPAIQAVVLASPEGQRLYAAALTHLRGRPNGHVVIGCSYGRHRSVALAEALANRLSISATHLSA